MSAHSPRTSRNDDHLRELRIPATASMVSRVRRALDDLDLPPGLADDARLLATELAANSVRHANLGPEERIGVVIAWSGGRLRVDVLDGGSTGRSPVAGAIRPAPGAESGWGHYLVERLSSRWGATPAGYWFELDLDGDRTPPA